MRKLIFWIIGTVFPRSPGALLWRADFAASINEASKAVALYNAYIENGGQELTALTKLAEIERLQGNKEKAIDYAKRAAEAWKRSAEVDPSIGLVYCQWIADDQTARLATGLAEYWYERNEGESIEFLDAYVALKMSGDMQEFSRGNTDQIRTKLIEASRLMDPSLDSNPHLRKAMAAATPGIFLNSLPKSGTVFIQNALCKGLGKPVHKIPSGGYFPDVTIAENCIKLLNEWRSVYTIHCPASWQNRITLSPELEKMIVLVRDPRQALLSWANFLPKIMKSDDNIHRHFDTPLEFATWNITHRVDWLIDNYLPTQLSWIDGWLDAAEDSEFTTEILFLTHEELVCDSDAFFCKILAFYEIDKRLFDFPSAPKEGDLNFRQGNPDEWLDVFSDSQIRAAASKINPTVAEKFGWRL